MKLRNSVKRLWAEQAAASWKMGMNLVLLDLPQDLPHCRLDPG